MPSGSYIGRDIRDAPFGVKQGRTYGPLRAKVDKPVYIWVPYKSPRWAAKLGGRWLLRLSGPDHHAAWSLPPNRDQHL